MIVLGSDSKLSLSMAIMSHECIVFICWTAGRIWRPCCYPKRFLLPARREYICTELNHQYKFEPILTILHFRTLAPRLHQLIAQRRNKDVILTASHVHQTTITCVLSTKKWRKKLIIITTSCMRSTMDLQTALQDAISKLDPHTWRFTCQQHPS